VRRRGGKRFNPKTFVPRDRHVSSHFNPQGQPKRRYQSFADGMLALERKGLVGRTVYRCEVCGDFHTSNRAYVSDKKEAP
jgi:hypothetical protein